MQIIVISGDTGAGKSTYTFMCASEVLWRDKKFFKKTGKLRYTYSNMKFAPHVEQFYGVSGIHKNGQIRYWEDSRALIDVRHANIIWDEIANELDAQEWQLMSKGMKSWLRQHRKFGNEIIANTQDFDQVDKSFRRLVHVLYWNEKLIGSPDISATRPAVKHPWGIVIRKSINPKKWDPAEIDKIATLSGAFFIRKENVFGFDTTQEIKVGEYPSFRHITRSCELPDCTFCKTVHV